MSVVYIGLGTNLGNREDHLRQAIRALETAAGPLLKCSSFMETVPWGYQSSYLFLNAAASFRTSLSPLALLAATQSIERAMGRTEKSHDGLYADRTIDIDLLLYDDCIIRTPQLQLPHPLLQERLFVLRPLAEIAPDAVHPVLHLTIRQLLEAKSE